MCIFGNSGSSTDTTEDKPFEYSKWFTKSYKRGEHFDGQYSSLFNPFASESPAPQAQKAANFNEDMGITDPNDPYAMLEANTRKPEEETDVADDKAVKTDRFKRRQRKDDNAKTGNSQSAFMNFYKG